MSNIPLKWIDFAKKYLALPEASKPVWLQKLSPKQQEYLKLILKELSDPAKKSVLTSKPAQNFDLKSRVSNENTTIGSNPASKSNLNHAQNPAQALNLSQAKFLTTNLAQNQNLNLKPNSTPSPVFNPQVAESQSFLMEFPNSQLQTSPYPQFSASADQSKPKTLNMSLIMPAQKFDLGIAAKSKKTLKQAKQLSVSANLSKQEYLKLKAGSMVKNTILQAFLVVLVLAVPIAGTISALNNSNSVKAIGSGQKSITQVLAEQNVGQVGVSDLDFKVWMADFKDLKDEDKTEP